VEQLQVGLSLALLVQLRQTQPLHLRALRALKLDWQLVEPVALVVVRVLLEKFPK
jgi:hypothetical protein